MDKGKAIELLKQALTEIPHLRELPHGNEEFELWRDKVLNILEAAFGKNSSEYDRFVTTVGVWRWDEEAYNIELDSYETALKSVIKKHELLGVETKPTPMAFLPNAPQDYKEKAANKELELILQGTPDMIMECIRSTVEELNSQGQRYGFRKTSGAPNYAKWDKTYFATCAISQGNQGQIGTIKLQLIAKEKTAFKYPEPKSWASSFGHFLNCLFAEFHRLGFVDLEKEKPAAVTELPPKAFISHGKESVALTKLEEFLRTLGVEPLIVKEQPSLDKTVNDKVNYYLNQADFVVVLATGEDEIDGKLHPRQNVIHEIGLAQKTHKGNIIYLLEEGAVFPSNISPKVWERFKQRNMINAFSCIVRELRAYGMLKVTKL